MIFVIKKSHDYNLRSENPIPCKIEIMDMRGTMPLQRKPPNTHAPPEPPAPSELRI